MSNANARDAMRQLRARETLLLNGILSGQSVTQASKAAGMSRAAGYRARGKETFQTLLRDARQEILGCVIDKLRTNALGAADTFAEVFKNPSPGKFDYARVAAGRATIELLYEGLEKLDLAERIAKLEELADGGPK